MSKEQLFFGIPLEVDIEKSEKDKKMIIRGYASTPDYDRQGESFIQKGLDISEFISKGFLNYDHDKSIILGYPSEGTKVDAKGLYVEGYLLDTPLSKRLYETSLALQKSNSGRRLGFSIEGKIIERQGNRITKAKVYHCALTSTPVNPEATWEAFAKSFCEDGGSDLSGAALEAGYGTSPETQMGGGALRAESLLGAIKVLAPYSSDKEMWVQVQKSLANGGTCTPAELLLFYQVSQGLSLDAARSKVEQAEAMAKSLGYKIFNIE